MKNKWIIGAFLLTGLTSFGQNENVKAQKEQIKKMCGCYKVGFNFAETFNHSKDSTYIPSKDKVAGALEWVQLVSEEDNSVSMQHLLIVGPSNSQMIIKHWRQDWAFENTNFLNYEGDLWWKNIKKSEEEVKGQWSQKVYQVDDSPRYEGSASWVTVDGKTYWESVSDAPLPRREYTQRSDYNVTERGNRHEFVGNGWIHDQDNKKIIREKGKEDIILAEEKGYNTYEKVADEKCQTAIDWWKKNDVLWSKVRKVWNEIYSKNKDIKMKEKVDGKHLFEHLFEMDVNTNEKTIKKLIKSYL